MKKMIKKVIAPVLVITVLFAVLRPFCIQDGECNYFLLLLLMGIPFGIGKMCVWMVPRGFDLGGTLAVFRYVTENTFDAYMWQILENKQKFISQIMTSKSPVRACEDVDDTALSYAEIKALATGNPYIKEKMDLDVQVSKLKLLKANHTSQIYRLEFDIAKNFPVQISSLKERIAGMQVDSQVVKSVDLQDNDTFAMTVGNVLYEDKKEAGEALIAACAGLKTVSTGGKVGEYHPKNIGRDH